MTSGNAYTSWDDRDSAPGGERGSGYLGSADDPGAEWSHGDRRAEWPRDDRASVDTHGDERDGRNGQAPASSPPPDAFKRGGFRSWPGWARVLTAIGVLVIVLLITHLFFFQAFSVPSSAMAPTMQAGNRVLVNKMVYDFRAPHRGEIVLFHGSSQWTPEVAGDSDSGIFASIGTTVGSWMGISTPSDDEFFRRVIAVPGDTIACCDVNGHVIVNGKPLNETYVHSDSPLDVSGKVPACGARSFDPVVIGKGNVFVMGDNRVASLDSRCVAQVPIDQIVGRATALVWSSWGSLSVPSTFDSVPKPYAMPLGREVPAGEVGLIVGLPALAAFWDRRASRRAGKPVARAGFAGREAGS